MLTASGYSDGAVFLRSEKEDSNSLQSYHNLCDQQRKDQQSTIFSAKKGSVQYNAQESKKRKAESGNECIQFSKDCVLEHEVHGKKACHMIYSRHCENSDGQKINEP